MNFDYAIGLVLLFFAYRAVRAVLRSFNAAATNPRKEEQTAHTPPKPAAAVYRGPRDMTARPATPSSVPRAALRLKTAIAEPPSRLPSNRSQSPFITDRSRGLPLLGILAVAVLIVLIAAGYAWMNEPPQRKPPGRNAERMLYLDEGAITVGFDATTPSR